MADWAVIWYSNAKEKVAVMAKLVKWLLIVLAFVLVAIASASAGISIGRKQALVSNEKMLTDMRHRYGFTQAIFAHRDLKAGDILTVKDLHSGDYFTDGLQDRLIIRDEYRSMIGRKMRVDLKRGSVLLKTDVQ